MRQSFLRLFFCIMTVTSLKGHILQAFKKLLSVSALFPAALEKLLEPGLRIASCQLIHKVSCECKCQILRGKKLAELQCFLRIMHCTCLMFHGLLRKSNHLVRLGTPCSFLLNTVEWRQQLRLWQKFVPVAPLTSLLAHCHPLPNSAGLWLHSHPSSLPPGNSDAQQMQLRKCRNQWRCDKNSAKLTHMERVLTSITPQGFLVPLQ